MRPELVGVDWEATVFVSDEAEEFLRCFGGLLAPAVHLQICKAADLEIMHDT